MRDGRRVIDVGVRGVDRYRWLISRQIIAKEDGSLPAGQVKRPDVIVITTVIIIIVAIITVYKIIDSQCARVAPSTIIRDVERR